MNHRAVKPVRLFGKLRLCLKVTKVVNILAELNYKFHVLINWGPRAMGGLMPTKRLIRNNFPVANVVTGSIWCRLGHV